MIDIPSLEQQQREWSEKNFPDRNPDHAIMGIIEEVGEFCEAVEVTEDTPEVYVKIMRIQAFLGRLAHIHLKRAQGIRKASTTEDREFDQLNQLERAVTDLMEHVGFMPFKYVEPEVFEADKLREIDAIGDIGVYLIDRCNRTGDSFGAILHDILTMVVQRDWTKNALSGKVDSE